MFRVKAREVYQGTIPRASRSMAEQIARTGLMPGGFETATGTVDSTPPSSDHTDGSYELVDSSRMPYEVSSEGSQGDPDSAGRGTFPDMPDWVEYTPAMRAHDKREQRRAMQRFVGNFITNLPPTIDSEQHARVISMIDHGLVERAGNRYPHPTASERRYSTPAVTPRPSGSPPLVSLRRTEPIHTVSHDTDPMPKPEGSPVPIHHTLVLNRMPWLVMQSLVYLHIFVKHMTRQV